MGPIEGEGEDDGDTLADGETDGDWELLGDTEDDGETDGEPVEDSYRATNTPAVSPVTARVGLDVSPVEVLMRNSPDT